jgi:hypothetical protein
MPVIDRDYVEKKKGIRKGDPVKIVYPDQEPELAFYEDLGKFFNVRNNGDPHAILPSEIVDVFKLVIVKEKNKRGKAF